MKHYKITFEPERKKLTVYHNDKVLGGMIGKIAEERFAALEAECEKVDLLKTLKNGRNKTKKAAV